VVLGAPADAAAADPGGLHSVTCREKVVNGNLQARTYLYISSKGVCHTRSTQNVMVT
jgi:hypothetical protein